MNEKRFTYTTRIITDKKGYCKYYIFDNETLLHTEQIVAILNAQADYIDYLTKENRLLHEENVKQCERWRTLYEIKDKEVTARVDALNKVCEYYTSEVLFKSDVDPNKAVKEVINGILNTEVEM